MLIDAIDALDLVDASAMCKEKKRNTLGKTILQHHGIRNDGGPTGWPSHVVTTGLRPIILCPPLNDFEESIIIHGGGSYTRVITHM